MRITRLILVFLTVFITFVVPVHATPLTLSIREMTGRPGASIQVPVEISGASNLGSLHLEVTYDPLILQAMSVTAASLARDALLDFNVQPGRVVIGLASADGISGTGKLELITCDVLE